MSIEKKKMICITKESSLVIVKLEPCPYSRFSFLKRNISSGVFPFHIINILVL